MLLWWTGFAQYLLVLADWQLVLAGFFDSTVGLHVLIFHWDKYLFLSCSGTFVLAWLLLLLNCYLPVFSDPRHVWVDADWDTIPGKRLLKPKINALWTNNACSLLGMFAGLEACVVGRNTEEIWPYTCCDITLAGISERSMYEHHPYAEQEA